MSHSFSIKHNFNSLKLLKHIGQARPDLIQSPPKQLQLYKTPEGDLLRPVERGNQSFYFSKRIKYDVCQQQVLEWFCAGVTTLRLHGKFMFGPTLMLLCHSSYAWCQNAERMGRNSNYSEKNDILAKYLKYLHYLSINTTLSCIFLAQKLCMKNIRNWELIHWSEFYRILCTYASGNGNLEQMWNNLLNSFTF